MLAFLKKIFKPRNWQEEYLARSVDHCDLERRIRKLDRGQVQPGLFGYKENF